MVDIMKLNDYKYKSSHNSYAKDLLHRTPDLSVINDFLREGYVGLEFDINKDKQGLYVSHFKSLTSQRCSIRDFLKSVIDHVKGSENHDPVFLHFDIKTRFSRSVQSEFAKEILDIFRSSYPNTNLEDIVVMPTLPDEGSVEKINGKYVWPSFSECTNKFLLGIHNKHHKRINDPNLKKFFFVDDSVCMANFNYVFLNKFLFGWRQKQKIRKKMNENVIVRIYPTPMEQALENNFIKNCAKLGVQLISVDFTKRGQAEVQFGMESKIIVYT